jgi:hypothetical protein
VAYKLDLPTSAKIHPVVHVPQLKGQVPPLTSVSTDLATVSFDLDRVSWPQIVLGAKKNPQMLIHWHKLTEDIGTWEDTYLLLTYLPFDTTRFLITATKNR